MSSNNLLRTGTLLKDDSYRIEAVLGTGGFGVTYRAVQVLLGKTVAIKEFFMGDYCVRNSDALGVSVAVEQNSAFVERFKKKFLSEARMVAKLTHRHIIDIYDVFEENNTAYYVMEYLPGGCVEDKVASLGAMSEDAVLKIVKQVGAAVSYIHSKKILHLDIKPANIMLRGDGDAVLIDFGISKHYDDNTTGKSTVAAAFSRAYAPLEQFEATGVKEFVPAVDVYSLAATAYYLVSGVQPPNSFSLLKEGLTDVPCASPLLTGAIVAAMQPLQSLRLQTVAEFLEMLDCNPVADKNDVVEVPTSGIVENVDRNNSKTIIESTSEEIIYDSNDPDEPQKKGISAWIVVVLVLLTVTLLAVAAYFAIDYFSNGTTSQKNRKQPKVAVVDEALPNEIEEGEDIVTISADTKPQTTDVDDDIATELVSEEDVSSQNSPSPSRPAGNTTPRNYATVSAEGIALMRNGNYGTALPLLREAAEHNIPSAQNALGECYQRGYGVSIDYSTAVSWYTRSANNGNSDAQYNLAVCYSRGLGVGRDISRAATYFEKAANQGHMLAQYNLAECYRNGTGVPVDYSTAAFWYGKAAAQGYEPAREKLSLVQRSTEGANYNRR